MVKRGHSRWQGVPQMFDVGGGKCHFCNGCLLGDVKTTQAPNLAHIYTPYEVPNRFRGESTNVLLQGKAILSKLVMKGPLRASKTVQANKFGTNLPCV